MIPFDENKFRELWKQAEGETLTPEGTKEDTKRKFVTLLDPHGFHLYESRLTVLGFADFIDLVNTFPGRVAARLCSRYPGQVLCICTASQVEWKVYNAQHPNYGSTVKGSLRH